MHPRKALCLRTLTGFFFLTTSVVPLSAETRQSKISDNENARGQSHSVPDVQPTPDPGTEPRILPHPDPDLALQPKERRNEENPPLVPKPSEPGLAPPPMPQPAKPGLPPPPMPQPAQPPPVITNPEASPAQPIPPPDPKKESEKT